MGAAVAEGGLGDGSPHWGPGYMGLRAETKQFANIVTYRFLLQKH